MGSDRAGRFFHCCWTRAGLYRPAMNPAFDTNRPNWYGTWTLYRREVQRFLKVYTQTVLGPIVSTHLFLAVFALALGRASGIVGGVPFLEFLAPGLIMMGLAQNAFANTSSSVFISKVQGNIIDTLMPPLSADELTFALAAGGVSRGLFVATAVGLCMSLFVPIHFHNVGFIMFHAVAAALMMSLIGLIAGIWAEKFDHMAAVTNFLVAPLAFLSGSFYSIESLPEVVRVISHLNPFFYMIDGFRYGFIGHSDVTLGTGIAVLTGVNLVLWLICRALFASGYKLKS